MLFTADVLVLMIKKTITGSSSAFAVSVILTIFLGEKSELITRDAPGRRRLTKRDVNVARDNLEVASPDPDAVNEGAVG